MMRRLGGGIVALVLALLLASDAYAARGGGGQKAPSVGHGRVGHGSVGHAPPVTVRTPPDPKGFTSHALPPGRR